MSDNSQLLSGVRVIESSLLGPGHVATFFADLGADVIKVESPAGDYIRQMTWPIVEGVSLLHLHTHRGKRGITLDLKTEEGKQIYKDLVATADVVVEAMRPGALAKLGLGYEDLKKVNPKIVFATLSGSGATGPYGPDMKKAAEMAEQLRAEMTILGDALRAHEEDIEKLQRRLREARSRQSSIAARLQSAENRVKLRTLLSSERVDEAMARFDQLERRVDYAEGRAEAMSLAERRQPTLADEIAALADGDKIEAELAEMKRAMGAGDAPVAKEAGE